MGELTSVLPLEELPVGSVRAVELGGTTVALARTPEGVFAVEDRCSHQDVPLSEGEVVDCTLECWLHGSAFDLRTGEPLGPPAVTPVRTFAVLVEDIDGVAMVRVSTEPTAPTAPTA